MSAAASATSTRSSLFEHAVFVDGALQTCHRPSAVFLCVLHLECACATIAVYVVLWETWYPVGLHVVPGIWVTVIVSFHDRLLF
jgi:hypothetical protein